MMEIKIIDGEEVAMLSDEEYKFLEQKKFETKLQKAGIPQDYWNLGFRHSSIGKNKESVEYCRNYLELYKKGKASSLFFFGGNSVGKTTTACAIAKEFIKEDYKVYFILAGDLIDILLKTSGFNIDKELEAIKKKYLSSHLMIIDDAFDSDKSVMWNTANKSILLALWDAFFRKYISMNGKIIFTSNIKMENIIGSYGKSISEMLERNCKTIEFTEREIKQIRKDSIK